MSSSEAKMRDPQDKRNRNKSTGRHVCIIGSSNVKHIASPGISKIDHVQVKAYPGATIDDIFDYIKTTIRHWQDVIIIYPGKNHLTKDVNIMSRVRKVIVVVKEIDTKGKIILGFSGIVARSDINKEKDY